MGDDNWAIYSDDGSLTAHFEHTIAITAEGPRILTPWHLKEAGLLHEAGSCEQFAARPGRIKLSASISRSRAALGCAALRARRPVSWGRQGISSIEAEES